MTVPWPGPAPQGLKAFLINGDDCQILGGGNRGELNEGIVQPEIKALGQGGAGQEQQTRDKRDGQMPARQAPGG